jgi:hypothetical protein
MLRHSRFIAACTGAAFGLASFVIALEMSATMAAPGMNAGPSFNRTLKGDRLPLDHLSAKSRNAINGPLEPKAAPRAPAAQPVLLEGCEPLVSPIGQPPLSRVPGRCLS